MANRRSFSNALKWAYTGNWGDKVLSSIFVFVIAGILGPQDFGIAAIAATYVIFLQLFLDQGLAAALIQRKELDQEHLDAVFWMDVALSFVLVTLSIFFSRWWAAQNHAPRAAHLIPVLSLSIVFEALSIVQTSLLRREMNFKSLSIRTNASVLIGGIVGVGMAFVGFGVWAIVGQQLSRDVSALVLLWKLSPWRPRAEFSWKHFTDLMGFSVPNFIAQLGIFVDVQAASIVLGLLFGPLAVGLYRLADRAVNGVINMAMISIQTVSFSEFCRLQDEPEQLREKVLTCIRLSSTTTLPALAGLAAVSTPLMEVIGSKWTSASSVLKVLCLVGVFMIYAFFTVPLLQALGRTRLVALLEWARTIVGALILTLAGMLVHNAPITWQIMGIALSRLATGAILVAPVFVYILMRLTKISLRDLIPAVAPAVVSSATVIGAMGLLHLSGCLSGYKPIFLLIADILVGGAIGLMMLLRFDAQLRLSVGAIVQRNLMLRLGLSSTPRRANAPDES